MQSDVKCSAALVEEATGSTDGFMQPDPLITQRCAKADEWGVRNSLVETVRAFGHLPYEMRKLPNWVPWGYQQKPGQTKKAKVPKQSQNPRFGASTTNPSHWGALQDALAAQLANGLNGVGFVLTNTPFLGVDLDDAFDASGRLLPWAERIVKAFCGCAFIEMSPSGRGLHLITRGSLKPGSWNKVYPEGKGNSGVIEMYDTGRYFTVTGKVYSGCNTIGEGQAAINWLQAQNQRVPQKSAYPQSISDVSDQKIIDRAMGASNGNLFSGLWSGDTSPYGGDHSRADAALCACLAFYTRDPEQIDRIFRASGLMRAKWDERRGAETYGYITVRKALDIVDAGGLSAPQSFKTSQTSQTSQGEDADAWTPNVKKWPTLGEKALYGIVGDFVSLATENSEADPVAVLATLLVRFGVEAGSIDPNARAHLYVGESRHEPRINSVLVGNSSKARKGTSGYPVQRLFEIPAWYSDAPRMATVSCGPLSTGEGTIFAVRDETKTWNEKEQFWVVSDPGVEDKRLYVHEEEFSAAINAGKRSNNTLSATIRALWDSGNLEPLTKANRISCTGAHVGILAHITIEELVVSLSKCDKLNGYANRFLWVLARRSKLVSRPKRMPDERFNPIQREICRRLNLAHRVGLMAFTPAADEFWDETYARLSEDRPGIVGTITARGEAQVIRLSMIYALLDGLTSVDSCHIAAALTFWKYAQASAEYIFADNEGDAKLDEKIKALLASEPSGLSLTELHKATHNHVKSNQMKASLQRLLDAHLLTVDMVETLGAVRRTSIFKLNRAAKSANFANYSHQSPHSMADIPDIVTI